MTADLQPAAEASRGRFSRDVIWSGASLIVFALGGAVWAVLTADGLGPEGKGALSLLSLVLMLAGLTCSVGTTYTMPALLRADDVAPGEIVASSVFLGALANAVVLAGAATIGPFVLSGRGTAVLLFGVSTLLPLSWLKTIGGAVLTTAREFRDLFLIALAGQVVQVGGAASLLALHRMTIFLAIATNSAGALASLVVTATAVRRTTPLRDLRPSHRGLRGVTRAALAAQPGIFAQSMNYRLDLFVVAWLATDRVVGVYAIAVFLAEVLFYPSLMVSQVLLPRAAAAAGSAESAYRIVMTLTFALAIAMWLAAPLVVHGLFSPRYDEAIGGVRALLPGTLALALWQLGTFELAGRGRLGAMSWSALAGIVATFAADAILVPRHGVLGASAGASIGYAITVALVLRPLCRVTRYRLRDLLLVRAQDLSLVAGEVRILTAPLLRRSHMRETSRRPA